jgi:hypothetical protein
MEADPAGMPDPVVMVKFKAVIQQFDQKGEKTGWSYISIPAAIAAKIKPGVKKSFRVKGKLDDYAISKASLLPMGEGNFILPINSSMRKGVHKRKGAWLNVQMQEDKEPLPICPELLECFEDAPLAKKKFNELPGSYQRYYSNWIESAKTIHTKSKRIAMAINALEKNMSYAEMLHSNAQAVNK